MNRFARRLSIVGLATALSLAAPSGARAATLYTPMVGFSTNPVACLAVNVGKKPVEVLIEAVDYTGTVNGSHTRLIDPGAAWAFNSGTGSFYCRFTFKSGKKNIRGSACMVDGGCLAAE